MQGVAMEHVPVEPPVVKIAEFTTHALLLPSTATNVGAERFEEFNVTELVSVAELRVCTAYVIALYVLSV
jgi:hypothetical protein